MTTSGAQRGPGGRRSAASSNLESVRADPGSHRNSRDRGAAREPAACSLCPPRLSISVPQFVGRIDQGRADHRGCDRARDPADRSCQRPTGVHRVGTASRTRGRPSLTVRWSGVAIATAAEQVVVPDLLGVPEPEALRLLFDAGLVPGARTETPAPLIDPGAIASQDPPAGARVPRGTPVTYSISTATISPSVGASTRPTPQVPSAVPPVNKLRVGDYRCMVLPAARAHIRDDGFTVGRISSGIEGGAGRRHMGRHPDRTHDRSPWPPRGAPDRHPAVQPVRCPKVVA